jgi:hypothetical protein
MSLFPPTCQFLRQSDAYPPLVRRALLRPPIHQALAQVVVYRVQVKVWVMQDVLNSDVFLNLFVA